MNRPLWKRWAIAVGVFAALSFGVAYWRGTVGRAEVVLPDGRGVSLAQATFGTRHELEEGSLVARMVAKLAGPARARRFGYRSLVQSTPAPALMVWTRWPNPPSNTPPRFASLIDAGGMETEPVYPSVDSSAVASGDRIMAWRFESYPRRAKFFHVRFHDRPPPYRADPLGSLRIRNPWPTNAPPAGGVEPPVVAGAEGEFVLRQLDVGEDIPAFRRPGHSGLAPWTEAVFEVQEGGGRSTNWTVRELQLRSAAGNFVRVSPLFVKARGGLIETGFTCAWWREEPDWVLTAVFGRIGDFGDTNLWIVPALPANGLSTALITNVVSPFLAPPGGKISLQPASPQSSESPPQPQRTDLELTYKPDNRHRRLELVRVTDQDGQELGFGKQADNGYGRFLASLELRPDTISVQLTFGISNARSVDFPVKPRFIGTGPAAPGLP